MPTTQPSTSRAVANRFWPGRRVLVAGGTHGFGLVLARQLAGRGAQLLLVGRSPAGVRAAIAACESAAAAAGWPVEGLHGLAADLAQPGEGDRAVAVCLEKLGGLDSLFFCIGRSGRTAVLKLPADEFRAAIEVNLITAIEISQAAADPICRAGGELVYIGYNLVPTDGVPSVTVGVVAGDGAVSRRIHVPCVRPSMQHDVGITATRTVLL
ncbi:MAG: SDR family NAD(P)-dependent oxidoreductase, partial [Pirellulales bacterium]